MPLCRRDAAWSTPRTLLPLLHMQLSINLRTKNMKFGGCADTDCWDLLTHEQKNYVSVNMILFSPTFHLSNASSNPFPTTAVPAR